MDSIKLKPMAFSCRSGRVRACSFSIRLALMPSWPAFCTTELSGDDQLLDRLDMMSNFAAYHIVQEVLNSVLKYAHCERIHVRLRIGEWRRVIFVLLDILDDGIGLKSLRQIAHGFYSICDWVDALNGVLHIQKLPDLRMHVLLRQ